MMSERGVGIAHTIILRWGSWRIDETYIKVRSEWMYLYGAVDQAGRTVDFHLSRKRDVNAAKAFLRKAMKAQRISTKMTLDAYAASQRAVAELKDNGEVPQRVPVRTSEYLNNLIEQDHRRVKQRLRPMLGLKSFRTAAVVISGIELAEKIKKKQFQISKLGALWVGE
jgi:transposase-like protein